MDAPGGLEDDGDRPGLRVFIGDGQGNTLSLFVDAEDDKLAGFDFPAMKGASISIMVTDGFSCLFETILYIETSYCLPGPKGTGRGNISSGGKTKGPLPVICLPLV